MPPPVRPRVGRLPVDATGMFVAVYAILSPLHAGTASADQVSPPLRRDTVHILKAS
jgi:hypothetical protein